MSRRPARSVPGADGLRTRVNGDWARKKLSFFDAFGPPALDATMRKRRRVYLDLFAGPGRNVDKPAHGEEFEGAAIRALRMVGAQHREIAFTDAYLFNLNRLDDGALTERAQILREAGKVVIPAAAVHIDRCDSNLAIAATLERIHPKDYIFAFADCEAPKQWPWSSVEALKAQGHLSVDLYMLFPLEMGLNRLMNYDRAGREQNAPVLDAFFGTDAWRPIVERRTTGAHSADFKREITDLYLRQLRRLWPHVGEVADVRLRGEQGLYRMLFATAHEAGKNIAAWARGQAAKSDQLGFPL